MYSSYFNRSAAPGAGIPGNVDITGNVARGNFYIKTIRVSIIVYNTSGAIVPFEASFLITSNTVADSITSTIPGWTNNNIQYAQTGLNNYRDGVLEGPIKISNGLNMIMRTQFYNSFVVGDTYNISVGIVWNYLE